MHAHTHTNAHYSNALMQIVEEDLLMAPLTSCMDTLFYHASSFFHAHTSSTCMPLTSQLNVTRLPPRHCEKRSRSKLFVPSQEHGNVCSLCITDAFPCSIHELVQSCGDLSQFITAFPHFYCCSDCLSYLQIQYNSR